MSGSGELTQRASQGKGRQKLSTLLRHVVKVSTLGSVGYFTILLALAWRLLTGELALSWGSIAALLSPLVAAVIAETYTRVQVSDGKRSLLATRGTRRERRPEPERSEETTKQLAGKEQ
jgi:hypothetical protein